jgi:hypothetical protein
MISNREQWVHRFGISIDSGKSATIFIRNPGYGKAIRAKERNMHWNLANMELLYPPDVYTGTFDNEKMQARHEELKARKIMALKEAVEAEVDPLAAMMKLHKRDHIQFLLNNAQAFRDADKYETAVIELYSKTNSPFLCGGDQSVWEDLFRSCDRKRLLALGDVFPFESATVYRISITGVAKGLSWTLSGKKARKFEERWNEFEIGRGKVFAVDVQRDNVLVYLSSRQEEEVILDPHFIESAEIREV